MPILRRPGPPAPRDDMDPRGRGTYPGNLGRPEAPEAPPEPPLVEDPPMPPGGEDPTGRGGEGPRDRATQQRPRVPTPGAGSVDTINPFPPMTGTPNISLARPMGGRGIFGGAGGLTGGGFGLAGDPTSNQASDPISSLIAQLKMKQGLF